MGASFKVNYYIRVISKLRFLLVILLFFFSFLFQEGREKWIRITKVVVKSHAFKFVHLNLLSQLSYVPLCTWGGLSSKVTSIITSCSSGQIPKSSYIVYNYSLDETELRAFLSPLLFLSIFFSPSKKKRYRIKREKGNNGDKKNHGVPFHLFIAHHKNTCLQKCLKNTMMGTIKTYTNKNVCVSHFYCKWLPIN